MEMNSDQDSWNSSDDNLSLQTINNSPHLLDWIIKKAEAIKKWLHWVTLEFSVPQKQILPKGNFLSQKYFFLLGDFFTPSFIFGLHLNYLIHYWKNYVKNCTKDWLVATSIIFERNIGWEISKVSDYLKQTGAI